jgi:anti-sigma-K factor RskA
VSEDRHGRYADDVGPYLLGALSALEEQAFERHLDECERCQRDVERLRHAADALPRAVTPHEPPPSLKASLMEVVERETERPRAVARPGLLERLAARLRARPAVAWAAAACVVGIAAGYGISLATTDAGDRTVLAQVDARRLPGAAARLVVLEGEREAVLRVSGMPPLERDRVYQVWLQRDGRVTSQALFAVGADGRGAAAVPSSVAGARAVMVTREPRGGSPAPTEPPVLTVPL